MVKRHEAPTAPKQLGRALLDGSPSRPATEVQGADWSPSPVRAVDATVAPETV